MLYYNINMGNTIQSNITKQTLSDYTSYMNQAVTNFYNSALSTCGAGNTINFILGAIPGGGSCPMSFTNSQVNVSNVATSNCNLTQISENSANVSFKDFIQNYTKTFIDQNAQNKNGFFAVGFHVQKDTSETSTSIANTVSTYFDTNISNSCTNINNASNASNVVLCGVYDGDTFNFSQNAMATAMTSCINYNTLNAFSSDTSLNKFWSTTDQALHNRSLGLGSVIAILGVIIVAIVIILAILIFLDMKHKKESGSSYFADAGEKIGKVATVAALAV